MSHWKMWVLKFHKDKIIVFIGLPLSFFNSPFFFKFRLKFNLFYSFVLHRLLFMSHKLIITQWLLTEVVSRMSHRFQKEVIEKKIKIKGLI